MYVQASQCPATVPKTATGFSGLGDCGCGCGGSCQKGLGVYLPVRNPVSTEQLQGFYPQGLGLFDSMDFTTWGIAEWGIAVVGAYLVLSLAGDVGRGASRVKRTLKRRKSRARLAA